MTQLLQSLKNIGPAMESCLAAADITTIQQLETLGAVEAYLRVSAINPKAKHKMVLYALWGALHNENCLKLAPEVKDMLNDMVKESSSCGLDL